jgi:hypothetical protein
MFKKYLTYKKKYLQLKKINLYCKLVNDYQVSNNVMPLANFVHNNFYSREKYFLNDVIIFKQNFYCDYNLSCSAYCDLYSICHRFDPTIDTLNTKLVQEIKFVLISLLSLRT